MGLIADRGWSIANIDSVVVAERPKLNPHISTIQARLADAMHLQPDQVSVKATTNEKLGPIGEKEAICSYAVALLMPACGK